MNRAIKLSVGYIASIVMLFGLFSSVLVPVSTAHADTEYDCHSATLEGQVQTFGVPTEAWFQWGKGNNVANNNTPHQVFSHDSVFRADITGLQENQKYSYRAMASNQFGQATGQTYSFTTPPCSQPPQTCQDPSATNYGGPLPCKYPQPQVCQDYNATNYGGPLPCKYPQPPQTCQDYNATNYGGPLPCKYPQPQVCQDYNATNYGGPLPCKYPQPQVCQDYNATNYGGPLPCKYQQPPQTCQDYNATNFGGPLPCKYQQPNPTVHLTADQTTVQYNGSTTLRWTSTNATSCNASGGTNGWAGPKSLSGSFYTGNLTNTVTYTITCTNNSGGSASDSVTVYVNAQPPQTCQDYNATNYGGPLPCKYPQPQVCQDYNATNYGGPLPCKYQQQNPTVNLTADDTNLDSGDSTTLRWTSTNATSCSSSGGTNGWAMNNRSLSGSFFTGALTSTKTYTITCINSTGQQASDSVTINVDDNNNGDRPTVNIRADDTSIDEGDSTTVRWTSENADSCRGSEGDNGWSGTRPRSGSFNTGDLNDDTTFRITCTNENGSATDSVTIRVDDNNNNNRRPTVNIFANPSTVNFNGGSTITWNSDNADSCRASGGTNGWSGNKSRSGSFFASNITSTTTFSISCTNDAGTAFDSTTVSVVNNIPTNNQPTVVITADQTNLAFNGATTVRWSTTNATSCFASGGSVGWAGPKSIGPGSFFTGSLTGTRTYTITCSNDAGSSTDSVTVSVRGQVLGTSTTTAPTSLVLVTSSVDRNKPIVPTLDNTNPCPGDEINYTITYQNIGTASISSLALRIDLPLEVDYMFSNPNNPIRSGQTLIFNLGTLRGNGQGTVTVRVRVRDNVPAGANLNFPAVLSYVDPSGFPQQVTANVSANVCGIKSGVALGASVFGAGFLPNSIFGWLLLLILILILVLLAKYLFGQPFQKKTITTVADPLGQKTTTTTIHQ